MSGQERQNVVRRPRGLTLEEVVEFMFDKAERNDRGCWIYQNKARSGDNPRTTFQGKEVSVARLVLQWKIGRPLRSAAFAFPEYARHTCGDKRCIKPTHLAVDRKRVTGKQIVEDYREGATIQQIADLYGVAFSHVHARLMKLAPELRRGKPRPRQSDPSERDLRILERRRAGLSLTEIGKLEGLTRQRVHAILKRLQNAGDADDD